MLWTMCLLAMVKRSSQTSEHLITPNTSGDLGEWSSELPVDDYIKEFASAGHKTYSICTASGNMTFLSLKVSHCIAKINKYLISIL